MVLAGVALVAIFFLKDEEWLNWLRDNPLNKERRREKKAPVHDNLKETLQALANVRAELQGA